MFDKANLQNYYNTDVYTLEYYGRQTVYHYIVYLLTIRVLTIVCNIAHEK